MEKLLCCVFLGAKTRMRIEHDDVTHASGCCYLPATSTRCLDFFLTYLCPDTRSCQLINQQMLPVL
jgi:hypothetical protein